MQVWKSSTLLVLAAFAVSVLLLFAKANLVDERGSTTDFSVSREIYSPAAADPQLRDPERAELVRQRPRSDGGTASAKTVARTTSTEAGNNKVSAAATETLAGKPFVNPFPEQKVPKSHVYYVVAATFSSPDNARRGLGDLKSKGLDKSFIGTFDEGKWFSVIANTFAKEESAHYMVKELERKHGVKAYVYHRKGD